ncbi:MAG: DUF433 domain-containing protein [Candidatus Nanohaloarchaea archaeon]
MAGIVSTSDTLGGKPRIEGTRVSAEQVFEMYVERGMSVEEIVEALPAVDVEGVESAIEFMKEYSGADSVTA